MGADGSDVVYLTRVVERHVCPGCLAKWHSDQCVQHLEDRSGLWVRHCSCRSCATHWRVIDVPNGPNRH